MTASPGYGPLAPVRDQTTGLELIMLPKGFEYLTFDWRNDIRSDGTPTPSAQSPVLGARVRR